MSVFDYQLPPCAGQTAQSIEQWLRENAQPGATVVLRHTQGGVLIYESITVTGIGKGRLYTDRGSFYFSGKSCFHPKGQSRLVIPTPETLLATKKLTWAKPFRWSSLTI